MRLNFLLDKLFYRDKSAKDVAKDRLRLVLMHDRADIPAPVMDAMRREIMQVLSKYVEIEESALDVSLERAEGTVALIANIPIRKVIAQPSSIPAK